MSARLPAARVASLPMYHSNPAAVESLWAAVAAQLRSEGLTDVPLQLAWPVDFHGHWLEPRLLLSQACGFPLVLALGLKVRVVGTFHYNVPGCSGALQRSQIVVRADDPATSLADLRGRCVAFNATDSNSGYNSLRAVVAPLARHGRFFGSGLKTGSHIESIKAVRDGRADIAAIDCVSLAGFARYAPELRQGVRVLMQSDRYPGLPLITASDTDEATLAALRSALAHVVRDPALAQPLEALFITGFEPLDFADYRPCQDMYDAAMALGCPTL